MMGSRERLAVIITIALSMGCARQPVMSEESLHFALRGVTADSITFELANGGDGPVRVSTCYVEREVRSVDGEWRHDAWIGDPGCPTIASVVVQPAGVWVATYGWQPTDLSRARLRFQVSASADLVVPDGDTGFATPPLE